MYQHLLSKVAPMPTLQVSDSNGVRLLNSPWVVGSSNLPVDSYVNEGMYLWAVPDLMLSGTQA